jgi:hypothetical protein
VVKANLPEKSKISMLILSGFIATVGITAVARVLGLPVIATIGLAEKIMSNVNELI